MCIFARKIMMTNIAVILAGGVGTRVGGNIPKQFMPLQDGRTVLECCVDAFEQCPLIGRIIIVSHADYVSMVQESMLRQGWQKVSDIVLGGKERWESSWNAIQHLVSDEYRMSIGCNVLFHDCARPFVSQQILANVCQALERYEAVSVAVPATDTMYQVEQGQSASSCVQLLDIPARATMWRAQTPQAFRLDLVRQAYEKALAQPEVIATDDCGIVHTFMPATPIYIVQGEEKNKKITFSEDLL